MVPNECATKHADWCPSCCSTCCSSCCVSLMDACFSATWLIHMHDMTHECDSCPSFCSAPYRCYCVSPIDACTSSTWLVLVPLMAHSYVCHGSFVCVIAWHNSCMAHVHPVAARFAAATVFRWLMPVFLKKTLACAWHGSTICKIWFMYMAHIRLVAARVAAAALFHRLMPI